MGYGGGATHTLHCLTCREAVWQRCCVVHVAMGAPWTGRGTYMQVLEPKKGETRRVRWVVIRCGTDRRHMMKPDVSQCMTPLAGSVQAKEEHKRLLLSPITTCSW